MQVACPACGLSISVADKNAGKRGRCRCGTVFTLAPTMKSTFVPRTDPAPTAEASRFCSACGSAIHQLAELCPKCGVRQVARRHTGCATWGLFSGGVLATSLCVLMWLATVGSEAANPMVKFHPDRDQIMRGVVAAATFAYGAVWLILAGPLFALSWWTRGK